MLYRSPNNPTQLSERAAGMRRLRRRSLASHRPFCSTNGCTTFLDFDEASGLFRCHVCGSRRLLSA